MLSSADDFPPKRRGSEMEILAFVELVSHQCNH